MFQNKNNQTTDGGQTILNQKRDLPIENLPVHTMKKDLEAIKHPELAQEIEEQEATPQPINRDKFSEAQKSSPFLAPSPRQNSASKNTEPAISDSRIKIIEPASHPEKPLPAPKPPVPSSDKPIFGSDKNSPKPEQHPHHINFGKVFAGVIAVLVIAIIAGTGYYFWITRQSAPEIIVTPPIIEPEPEPVAKFLTDKPNVLMVDTATATSTTLKELLQNTAKDVANEKTSSPIEFIVTGTDENPVIFKDFLKISGVALSPALTANFSDTFSLFIYNDNTVIRGGLAIDSIDPTKLKGLLAIEEKNLIKNIGLAFPISKPAFVGKTFASSDYDSTAIRYLNITSPEDWSIDYAIYNDKLVVGTTKMTMRSILDYLKPQAE